MWKLIVAEIKYSGLILIPPLLGLFTYTYLAIADIQLTTSPTFEIDYWGGIFSFIIYAFLIAVWGTRIKEKRIRLSSLLPISDLDNSLTRFLLATFPFLFLIIYLVFFHLILIDNWHSETGSMLGQIGVTLILFAGFIKCRDDWYSHWNFGKRFQTAFVTVLIVQVLVVFIFLEMEEFKSGLVGQWGYDAINYSTLIFPLLGFIIMFTGIYSYRKRGSYLV